MNSSWFTWVILPALIFLARVTDVSIGTMRIVYISRENRVLAPILGFFEVLIWLVAIGQIFRHLDNVLCYVAYAGGFATGNFVGMTLERRFAVGMEMIRVVTRRDASELIERLKGEGFGLTVADGQGATGPVKIIFSLIRRKDQPRFLTLLRQYNPNAFYSIENVQFAHSGVFPLRLSRNNRLWAWFRGSRKGK